DHKAFLVARHGLKHVHRFAQLTPGKCGVGHAPHQIADVLYLGKVKREHRGKFVRYRIMQLAVNSCALVLLLQASPQKPVWNGKLTLKSTRSQRSASIAEG